MRTNKKQKSVLTTLFSGTCVRILSLLYTNPERSFYLREIAKVTGLSPGVLQRELSRLVDAELLTRQKVGNQVHYGANKKSHVYEEIRGLVIKTFGLADVIRDVLRPYVKQVQTAFIYGSQADGSSTSQSDVDIMIVGEADDIKLHKAISVAEKKTGKMINYTAYSPAEFRKKRKEKDGFVDRIVSGRKIILMGDVDEI